MTNSILLKRHELPITAWDWTGTVYICGPMSSLTECNVTSFRHVSDTLAFCASPPTAIKNPASLNQSLTYQQLITLSFQMMLESDLLIVLPSWQYSVGATNEIYVAVQAGKRVRFIHPAYLDQIMVFETAGDYLQHPL